MHIIQVSRQERAYCIQLGAIVQVGGEVAIGVLRKVVCVYKLRWRFRLGADIGFGQKILLA